MSKICYNCGSTVRFFFLPVFLLMARYCFLSIYAFVDGLGTKVNKEGITYYNNVIDALLEKGNQEAGR